MSPPPKPRPRARPHRPDPRSGSSAPRGCRSLGYAHPRVSRSPAGRLARRAPRRLGWPADACVRRLRARGRAGLQPAARRPLPRLPDPCPVLRRLADPARAVRARGDVVARRRRCGVPRVGRPVPDRVDRARPDPVRPPAWQERVAGPAAVRGQPADAGVVRTRPSRGAARRCAVRGRGDGRAARPPAVGRGAGRRRDRQQAVGGARVPAGPAGAGPRSHPRAARAPAPRAQSCSPR